MTPTGYSIVLPKGWRQVRLREETTGQVAALVAEVVGALPPGIPDELASEVRAEFERRLTHAIGETRAADEMRLAGGPRIAEGAFQVRVLDLYLPVLCDYGMPLPASFTVSRIRGPAIDPAAFALRYSQAVPDAVQPKVVDSSFGFRQVRVQPPGQDFGFATHRVSYIVEVPGTAGSWLAVVFTALGAGNSDDRNSDDRGARVLTELFDGVMTTFRWCHSG